MEAIAALGLACSVVQLVDFGLTLTEKCRDVYKAGNTAQNEALQRDAGKLSQLTQSVEQSMRDGAVADRPASPSDLLQTCAKHCLDAAQELENYMKTLTATPGRRRDALKVSLKTMWKKDKIEELQKQLERQQAILDTNVLIDLRKRNVADQVQISGEFSKLDIQVRNIAIALTNNMLSTRTIVSFLESEQGKIRATIRDDGSTTRAHMDAIHNQGQATLTKGLDKLRLDLKDSHASKLLRSLAFPEMNTRREDVSDAHSRTFRWVFGTSDSETERNSEISSLRSEDIGEGKDHDNQEVVIVYPSDDSDDHSSSADPTFSDFVEWLRTGTGCYWINGKAGAGKSTLMNFIYESEECSKHLQAWAKGAKLMRPNFFFWNPGNEIQKSMKGLFRALMYQILDSDRSLSVQIESMLDSHQTLSLDQGGLFDIAWSEKKLRSALQGLVSESQNRGHRICLFIDGLDEFDGDRLGLLEWISTATKSPNVKACVSSRPWPLFTEAFACSAQLKLQDLTQLDIRGYIDDEFTRKVRDRFSTLNPGSIESLAERIEHKADGVFLWVKLVVRDLLEALPKGDSLSDLHERLHIAPTELEALFQHMIDKQIDKVHRKKALEYFGLMLCTADVEMSLLTFALATWEPLRASSASDIPALNRKAGLDHTLSVKRNLISRTAGLLELSGFVEGPELVKRKDTAGFSRTDQEARSNQLLGSLTKARIKFLHRSIFEWLSGTDRPKWADDFDGQSHLDLLLKGSVTSCCWRTLPLHENCEEFWENSEAEYIEPFDDAMRYALLMQDRHHQARVDLLDLVGESFAQQSHTDPWFLCTLYASKEKHVALDFPGIAMRTGLTLYVQRKLLERPTNERKSYAEYLLCCQDYSFLDSGPACKKMLAAKDLLSTDGANPNGCVEQHKVCAVTREIVYTKTTPWLQVLKSFAPTFTGLRLASQEISMAADIACYFIERGANVNDSIIYQSVVTLSTHSRVPGVWLYLQYEMSLAALLHTNPFRTKPNVPKLRQALLERNALLTCKPLVLLRTYRSGSGIASRSFPLAIAGEKLKELTKPLMSFVLSGDDDRNNSHSELKSAAEGIWDNIEPEPVATDEDFSYDSSDDWDDRQIVRQQE